MIALVLFAFLAGGVAGGVAGLAWTRRLDRTEDQ